MAKAVVSAFKAVTPLTEIPTLVSGLLGKQMAVWRAGSVHVLHVTIGSIFAVRFACDLCDLHAAGCRTPRTASCAEDGFRRQAETESAEGVTPVLPRDSKTGRGGRIRTGDPLRPRHVQRVFLRFSALSDLAVTPCRC